MSLFNYFYNIFLDALFPISEKEKELFSYSPKEAYEILTRAKQLDFPNLNSIFAYKDERVAKLIWNIKYKKSELAIKIGGYALFQTLTLGRDLSLPKIIIIPIPISQRRHRERGYNQCELLVDEISRLDTEKIFTIKKDLLIRSQHTSRQTLKNRDARIESSKGIFEVDLDSGRDLLSPNQIIIIDDVITTGSTMTEAIDTFRKAGFLNVRGLSLAH